MNPEENNPLANPGTPDFGATGSSTNPGLSMSDSLASAEDSLTSAGMAANNNSGVMGLDQLGAANPEAMMTPPIEEPLVPAAPVPGSIGSVTSVPPIPTDPAPATPAFAPLSNAYAPSPAPAAPEAAPQAPYNPFAQPVAPSPAPTPAPAPAPAPDANPASAGPASTTLGGINPAFQPAANPAAKFDGPKALFNPLTIILAITTVLFLVAAIVFFIMWNQARNDKEIIYVNNNISNEDSNAAIHLMNCSRENDYTYLIGYDHPVIGSEQLTLNYAGDSLKAITLDYVATFDSEADANVARDNFAASQVDFVNNNANGFEAKYTVNGNTMTAEVVSKEGDLSETDARTFIYNTTENDPSLALETVKKHYEESGFVCTVE